MHTLRLVALVVCAAGALAVSAPARADTQTKYYTMSQIDNQVTGLWYDHYLCGKHWAVAQEVHWGAVTATWAYVRYVKYTYYNYSPGLILGGASYAYGGGLSLNDPYGDRGTAYGQGTPAGSWIHSFERRFTGGQRNGYVVVNFEKHSQMGSYETGDECHGRVIGVFYTVDGSGGGGCRPELDAGTTGRGRNVPCL